MAVLFIDLDKFKPVNDRYGHNAGDLVLQEISQRMSSLVRSSDTLARFGGDEFVALLDIRSELDAPHFAEKILECFVAEISINDTEAINISASIGISLFPNDADTAETLLYHADQAMYQTKKDPEHQISVYLNNS